MKKLSERVKKCKSSSSCPKYDLQAFRTWLIVWKNLTYGGACDCCTYLRKAINYFCTDSDLFKRLTPEMLSGFSAKAKIRRACYYYDEYKRRGRT